ncbi:MAG: helix-turn-helix transcriptional regulator [Bacteroidota bacterium]
MKRRLLLLFLFVAPFLFSYNFTEIGALSSGQYNEALFREMLEDQRNKYHQSHDMHNLLAANYIEAFIYGNKGDNNKRILKFLWVIENCPDKEFEIYALANYHLSYYLVFCNSDETAAIFANNALRSAKKAKITGMVPLIYSLKGSISYNLKNYRKAIVNYKNALISYKEKRDKLFEASMNNNISLCFMQLGNYPKSNHFIELSLKKLDQIRDKNAGEEFFQRLVRGNLGSNYYRMGRYAEAKPLLHEEVAYYESHPNYAENALHPVQELLDMYGKEGNRAEEKRVLYKIPALSGSIQNLKVANEFTKILYDYAIKTNDLKNIRYYGQELIRNNQLIFDSIINNSRILNNTIYDQQIRHMKKQFKTRDKLFQTTLESKQKSNTFMLLLVSSISIILIILFIERNRREKRNKVILAQEQLIETKKRIILENEVKLKQEKITNLALNLNLKKETENAFLQKMKEIKRKKNTDPETILKELQLSVTNLINIDQKNAGNSLDVEEENSRFILELQKLHPGLSKQELTFCSYFRMNLNSKEIASITNMTSGTIRVYKNKIKAKAGLLAEENLNDYLQEI